ncbi:MAG: hypothetical protein KAG97_11250, partial [Victivallales bacterium]|nr:hypothetical protein [Victivallales bacterium]
ESASTKILSPLGADSEDLKDASLIILDFHPSAKLAEKLRSLAEKGAMVLFFPPETQTQKSQSWMKIESFPKGKPIRITEWNRNDGVLADTPSGDAIPLSELRILKRAVPLVNSEKTAVLAYYSDGKPFLTREKIGEGKFLRCSTLPSPAWSNLGDGLVLVPIERRLMTGGAARFANVKFAACRSKFIRKQNSPPNVLASSAEIASNARPALDAGIYSWSNETLVVNLPPAEASDSYLSDDEALALTPGNKIRLFHYAGAADNEMQAEIWRTFLIVVLLALLAESLITLPRLEVSRQ